MFTVTTRTRLAAVLLSLNHKSFLKHRQTGCCEMLDLLRKFVKTKARFSPEEFEEIRLRHAVYFGNWLREKEPELKDGRQKSAIKAITEEIQNILKGWHWAVSNKRTDLMEQYLEGLFYFYELRGWYEQGAQDLQDAFEVLQKRPREANETKAIIGKILARQGRFCLFLDQFEKAQALFQLSIPIFKRLNLKREWGWALNGLGVLFRRSGRIEKAKTNFMEGLLLFEDVRDHCGITVGQKNLGAVFCLLGEYDDAKRTLKKALNNYRARQDKYNIFGVLNNLGIISEREGNYAEAVTLHREGLEMYTDINDEYVKTNHRNNLGFAYLGNGQPREAEECFRETVKTAVAIQARFILLEGLLGLAHILEKKNEKEKALEITGYMLHTIPIIVEITERAAKLAEKLRRQFDEPEFGILMENSKSRSPDYFVEMFKKRGML